MCSRHDWVINYLKEQTLTMALDMKRKHPSMLIIATPCAVCVMVPWRKQDSGRAQEDYRLLLTMSHSDSETWVTSAATLLLKSGLALCCWPSWSFVTKKTSHSLSRLQTHDVEMFDMMPSIWAEIIQTASCTFLCQLASNLRQINTFILLSPSLFQGLNKYISKLVQNFQ